MSAELLLYNGLGSQVGSVYSTPQNVQKYLQINNAGASASNALTVPFVAWTGTNGGSVTAILSGAIVKQAGQWVSLSNISNGPVSITSNTGTFNISSSVTSSGTFWLPSNTQSKLLLGDSQWLVV